MAIVAFWSEEEKETGQTMSMVALSTYMAIEHNYRILDISANFKDQTLENSYWDTTKMDNLVKTSNFCSCWYSINVHNIKN